MYSKTKNAAKMAKNTTPALALSNLFLLQFSKYHL
jgi:hypothetical protein